MKKVVLLIWLWAMGYGLLAMGDGLLAMGDGLLAMGDGLLANDDPYALRQEALRDFDQGKAAEAQKKLIQAHDLFVRAENWDMASMCLYERAIDYMNIGDWANMSQQCEELKSLNELHPSSMVAYNYHSVASGYYSYVDSIELAIAHGWRAIDALEQIDNPSAYNIVPVWSYYNMAFFYDMYFQPPMVDSVRHYLSRARASLKDSRTRKDTLEALISIVDLEAWQEYYEKDYAQAEAMMQEVIVMVDTVAKVSPNTVITERGEAYKFLAMIYEEQGRWNKAFAYQQKLLDNNELRYNEDKRRVLQEVQTQYEVEKQQLELDKLAAENRSNRWIMVALWLLLLLLVIGYWLLVMGRRNAEAKLYEAALEADNMRQTIQCLESQTDVDPLVILVDELVGQLEGGARRDYVERTVVQLRELDLGHIQVLLSHGKKITTMDKRYVLCFAAGMTVEEIADFMSLEPASVYTVRYRLRKKFSLEYPFPY
jgi:tetratricopeptide (TPR) repeat protein